MMFSFESDYTEGCTPEILEALAASNLNQQSGYGEDVYSLRAKEKIRAAIACPDADIFFLCGGTQTNQLAIDSMLAPYEGVIAAESGHVSVHEAGAIEYTGHKVLTLPSHEGKLRADEVDALAETFYQDANHEHMVFPGMVYISHPTEFGTLYTADELTALSDVCKKYQMKLYMDGARLGYALASPDTDVTLPLLARLCDAFYIGGTKVGALIGEALIFTRETPAHMIGRLKQHGALLAKGRLIGIQFDTLFTDDLYLRLGSHAMTMAKELKEIFKEAHIPFYIDSPTNQQFVILENEVIEKLSRLVRFSYWDHYDASHTVMRFATSWATRPESLCALREALREVL